MPVFQRSIYIVFEAESFRSQPLVLAAACTVEAWSRNTTLLSKHHISWMTLKADRGSSRNRVFDQLFDEHPQVTFQAHHQIRIVWAMLCHTEVQPLD